MLVAIAVETSAMAQNLLEPICNQRTHTHTHTHTHIYIYIVHVHVVVPHVHLLWEVTPTQLDEVAKHAEEWLSGIEALTWRSNCRK